MKEAVKKQLKAKGDLQKLLQVGGELIPDGKVLEEVGLQDGSEIYAVLQKPGKIPEASLRVKKMKRTVTVKMSWMTTSMTWTTPGPRERGMHPWLWESGKRLLWR